MKTFKQYNESVRDFLQPKSDEEIKIATEQLEQNELINNIIINRLDFKLLPRNEDGRCIYNGYLNTIPHSQGLYLIQNITKLPDNFTVKGWLNFMGHSVEELPKGLIVTGNLSCGHNKINYVPSDIKLGGDLYLEDNKITSLPDNLTVGRDLVLIDNPINKLPKGLKVRRDLWLPDHWYDNKDLKIPDDTIIGGQITY